jgi:uncharacterized protein with PIN domain
MLSRDRLSTILKRWQKEKIMPKKQCPKCNQIAEKVNRVFSVISIWDENEDDYRYDDEELYNAEIVDKCLECGTELQEVPDVHLQGLS